MMEERKAKRGQFYGMDALRKHFANSRQAIHIGIDGEFKELGQKFRQIFNNIIEGVILTDPENSYFVLGNKAVCQMLGHHVEDTRILKMKSICPPENEYHLIEQFKNQADGDLVLRQNIPFKRKDGDLFYADIISITLTVSHKRYVISFLRKSGAQMIKPLLQDNTYLVCQSGQSLTVTEMRILRLIVEGKSNKEIAKTFHRSKRTIENHRAHLMKKLNVDNSIELYKQALREGLVELPGTEKLDTDTRDSLI